MQTPIRTGASFGDLLRLAALRPFVKAIVARVQPRTSEGHADLASSSPSSPVRGQSRQTLVTGNEGCVRYPTEGNDSNHELTTAMHHLSYTLEGFPAFAGRAVGFLALVRFFA